MSVSIGLSPDQNDSAEKSKQKGTVVYDIRERVKEKVASGTTSQDGTASQKGADISISSVEESITTVFHDIYQKIVPTSDPSQPPKESEISTFMEDVVQSITDFVMSKGGQESLATIGEKVLNALVDFTSFQVAEATGGTTRRLGRVKAAKVVGEDNKDFLKKHRMNSNTSPKEIVYHQSTGIWRYEGEYDGKKVVVEGQGYSGAGEGLNNPDMEGVENVGPIPRGVWRIEGGYRDVVLKPAWIDKNGTKHPAKILYKAFRLVNVSLENPNNDKSKNPNHKGRIITTFLIHGQGKNSWGHASQGCIIMPPERINQLKDGDIIRVVR